MFTYVFICLYIYVLSYLLICLFIFYLYLDSCLPINFVSVFTYQLICLFVHYLPTITPIISQFERPPSEAYPIPDAWIGFGC